VSVGVYVTCPNGDGYIHKLVHVALCRILSDRRYRVRHDCPTHRPYANNLHHCINDFLDSDDQWWLSMDDDNPPRRNPLDLIELDCDLIGLPTPVWHSAVPGDRPWYLNALQKVDGGYKPAEPLDGLTEVDAIGSGCFLVARRVIEAVAELQPFARQWNHDGTVALGGDFSFCEKVRRAGFRIWAHGDYMCDHIQTLPLLEVIERVGQMYQGQH